METVAPNICLLHPAIFKVRGKGLTQEAQVLKPCMFPRKVCLQDWPLASSWEMNSEPLEYSGWFKNKQKNKKLLWFVCLGPWAARYHFDRIVYANSVVCGEWLFLLWEAGVWIAKLSHRGASYICDCWPPHPPSGNKPGREGSGELPSLAALCICAVHCCWKNSAYHCDSTGKGHFEA